MSKAIVVLDEMPKNSNECPLFQPLRGYDSFDYCPIHHPTKTVVGNSDKRCDGCPLRNPLKPINKKSQREQALELLLEWAIECDFGYDNLGEDLYKEYKDEIESLDYNEGLIYIAEKELKKKEK